MDGMGALGWGISGLTIPLVQLRVKTTCGFQDVSNQKQHSRTRRPRTHPPEMLLAQPPVTGARRALLSGVCARLPLWYDPLCAPHPRKYEYTYYSGYRRPGLEKGCLELD